MANIVPTKVDVDDWWKMEPVEPESLRPKPKKNILLVVGDGKCVWDDLGRFYDMCSAPFDTALLNHVVLAFPNRYEHFVCGDSHMKPMQAIAVTLPKEVIKHCWNPGSKGFDVRWVKQDGRGWNGTTATLAVKMGIALDYLRIVLAGCPMDNSGHWYDSYLPETDAKLSNDHRHHLWYWTEMATRPIGRFVRSMSGNTADLFGTPNKEWLNAR